MRLKMCTRYDEEDARNMFGRRRRLHNNKYRRRCEKKAISLISRVLCDVVVSECVGLNNDPSPVFNKLILFQNIHKIKLHI